METKRVLPHCVWLVRQTGHVEAPVTNPRPPSGRYHRIPRGVVNIPLRLAHPRWRVCVQQCLCPSPACVKKHVSVKEKYYNKHGRKCLRGKPTQHQVVNNSALPLSVTSTIHSAGGVVASHTRTHSHQPIQHNHQRRDVHMSSKSRTVGRKLT